MQQAFDVLGRMLMPPYRIFRSLAARAVGAERAELATRFLVFVTRGGLGWLLNIAVTVMLSRVFGVWQMLAYAVGLVFNIAFNFSFHKYITFGVNKTELRHSVAFAVITLAIVAANWLVVYLFTEIIYQNLPTSVFAAVSFVATLFLSIINFAANKLFVFSRSTRST